MGYKDDNLKSAIMTTGIIICIVIATIVWMFNG